MIFLLNKKTILPSLFFFNCIRTCKFIPCISKKVRKSWKYSVFLKTNFSYPPIENCPCGSIFYLSMYKIISIYISIYLTIYLIIYLFIYLSMDIYLNIYISIFLSIYKVLSRSLPSTESHSLPPWTSNLLIQIQHRLTFKHNLQYMINHSKV